MSLAEKEMYQFGPFSLDPTERTISCDGTSLPLTPKVFDTLVCLVRNPGRLLRKDELLKEIWPETFVEEVNLAVNISTLRKALGESPQDCRYIATVPGKGYRFVAEVRQVSNVNGVALPAPQPSTTAEARRGEANGTENTAVIPPALEKIHRLKRALTALLALLVFAAVSGYFGLAQRRTTVSSRKSVSVAVLPFADLSPGKDQEYLSDGLTEELINDLAKVPAMRIVGRSSAFQFKDKNEDLRSVGRKLGVANILGGSLRREGDRVRIRVELTRTSDGFQLWSETYDRKIDDIFAVQDEIARAATEALQVKLLSPRDVTTRERSGNAAAYEAYLRARYFTTRGRDSADLDHALTYVEQAIKLDPKYASAWALRSYILDTMADVGMMEPATAFPRAREDAERAIELDSNGASGYLALAWVQINRDWNWEGAEISLNKAAEAEPGSASILRFRSFLCHSLGRLNEAIEYHKPAIAQDPLFASSHSYLAYLLYSAGRYDEAENEVQAALELNPQKTYDHFTRGEILLAQGQAVQALTETEKEPAEIWRLTGEALVYHALGRRNDSNAALARLIKDHQGTMAYQIAEIYADRGESDKAFEWLNRAYDQHDSGLRSLKIDPYLKSLRRDPRYAEFLKKMHLPA